MRLSRIKTLLKDLGRNDSGNALMLMALGMPMLIGSSGLAVDVAQWYIWRRELQYAVDQAALAGAWASAEPEQKENYAVLAKLEFDNNLSYLSGRVDDPVIGYEDWNGGTDNTVVATATFSQSLPFSSILWDDQATVNVRAQASFQAATNYTTCLLALDPDADDAFVIGGTIDGAVTCGVGSLSNSASAIRKNGSTTLNVADLIAAGGIDEGLATNGVIHEFISNLSNPYDGLTPPDSPGARTYTCDTSTTMPSSGGSTATIKTRTVVKYVYRQATNLNNSAKGTEIIYDGTGAKSNSDTTAVAYSQSLTFTPQEGWSETVSDTGEVYTGNYWASTAKKNSYIYEFKQTTVTRDYYDVVADSGATVTVTGSAKNLQPGTYGDITVGCETFFNPGVYIITGVLDFGQNHYVHGDNVLFVFTGEGSERFKLNSQSKVQFSGITYDQLVNQYSVDPEEAEKLNGMIIWDPNSTETVAINGGADTIFDGILYMPNRHAKFNGNATVEGSCMMLAAGTIELTGTSTIKSLCMPTDVTSFDIGGTTISVRLVA